MKRTLLFAVVLGMSPGMLYAQGNLENDLDAELSAISAARSGKNTGAAIAPQGSVGAGSQPIYILNQATPTSTAQVQQAQVQKQPQVDIYGAPVQASKADLIREARQKAEIETENRIAEKLEQSRIQDERARAERLFGNTLNQNTQVNAETVNMNQQQGVQAVQAVQAVPVVTVVKEEKASEANPDATRDIVREELRAAIDADKATATESSERRYFGAMAGINELPDASNVRGNFAFSASYGTVYDGSYAVEGTFTYANYTVADLLSAGTCFGNGVCVPREIDTDQFSGSVAMKYIFMDGMFKPMAGGLMQYSYRTFAWNDDFSSCSSCSTSGDASSHAIDLGLVLGADVEFSKKFSLGFDFRYLWNMASRVNAGSYGVLFDDYMGTKPIEKFQYYTMGVVGRMTF